MFCALRKSFKELLPLIASTVNEFFAVNTVNKSNALTNGTLINERKQPWTKLNVQLLVKNEIIGTSVTLILLTVNERIEKRSNVSTPRHNTEYLIPSTFSSVRLVQRFVINSIGDFSTSMRQLWLLHWEEIITKILPQRGPT